jgi:hypothetical protein
MLKGEVKTTRKYEPPHKEKKLHSLKYLKRQKPKKKGA